MTETNYTLIFAHLHKRSGIYLVNRLKELGVNIGQFPPFMCVCRNPGLTQDEIAAKTRTDKSTVAKMLKQLEENGFVKRKCNTMDKRALLVYPTRKALKAYPALEREKQKWHAERVRNLTPVEKQILDLLLNKLAE